MVGLRGNGAGVKGAFEAFTHDAIEVAAEAWRAIRVGRQLAGDWEALHDLDPPDYFEQLELGFAAGEVSLLDRIERQLILPVILRRAGAPELPRRWVPTSRAQRIRAAVAVIVKVLPSTPLVQRLWWRRQRLARAERMVANAGRQLSFRFEARGG